MTPRERAEALGWVREEFRCQPFWRQPGVLLYWSPADAEWVMDCWPSCDIGFPTEDEALAHALLLRDVVLS